MNNHLKSQDLIYNVNFLIYIMFIIMQQYYINLEWFKHVVNCLYNYKHKLYILLNYLIYNVY